FSLERFNLFNTSFENLDKDRGNIMDKSELILKTTKELKDIAESGANKIALAMQEAKKANYII
ncbi:hypothetical protein AB4544_19140, partial [Vibrio sp. 10N.222.45.F7]|uniref:hypothetical protein n=1 Tax=Vibrio sp. 10N.222.45.F7 TaxID=3229598 RepID=UPI00354CE7BF